MSNDNPTLKERMAKVETKIENLDDRLTEFITNDFEHLRSSVTWLIRTVVVGTFITIVLLLVSILLGG